MIVFIYKLTINLNWCSIAKHHDSFDKKGGNVKQKISQGSVSVTVVIARIRILER